MNKTRTPLFVVLLIALFASEARAAAPAGAWWDGNYTYRQQISIPAGASALATAYSTSITFDHATQVAASHSLASGNDVRVVYWNGATWVELDRIADPDNGWNSSATTVWFATQAAIGAGSTDDNYYLYYGFTGSSTPSSTTPLQDPTNIFLFYDDFSGATLNATLWSNSGAAQTPGLLTLTNGDRIRSVATFGVDTIWETRATLSSAKAPSGTGFSYWGATSTNNTTYTSPYLRFISTSTITNHTAQDSLTGTTTFAPTSPTTSQQYAFTREGNTTTRFLVNGSQVATFTHASSTTPLRILLRNDTANGQTMVYNWARIRNYRNPEPVPTLGSQGTFTPAPIASYSFEEASWNGTAGEVKDSTTNALNGTARGSATTANASPAVGNSSTGTCRYATLNGANSFVQIATAAKLNMTTAFGVAAWVRHHTNTYKNWEAILTKGDSAYRVHLNGGCNIATSTLGTNSTNGLDEGLNSGCATADLNSNQIPAANTWYHLGATYRNGEMRIYVNGNLMASAAYSPPLIGTNAYDLAIGENLQQTGRFWDGDVDEVTLWDQPVAQSTIQAHMAATHACSTVPHFVIQTNAYGIHCAPQTVTVYVRDLLNNPITTYNQQVTLDTGTGKGDWSLVTGSGTLTNGTANDGIATYQWPLGESSAVFSLSYKEGAASTPITVYQTNTPTIRDDGTTPAVTWTASGFTVTSSALGNPPPGAIPAFSSPQIAGNNFAMYLTAYGTTPTDAQCGVIESYTGNKSLKFWSTYVNPNSGTRTVSINGGAIATTEAASGAQTVTFTNGQANVTALYRDAGLISINMKDDTTGNPSLPTGIRGGTGNIVVRPSTFVLSNIKRTSDNFANPAAGAANGTVFIAAGQSFTATVTAMESGGTATPNFGKETPAESVGLTPTLVLPAAGQNPAIVSTTGFGAFTNGVATGTDFSWSEVGIITLTPHIKDSDYLGAGDFNGTITGNVGRFIPANFLVTANTPSFQTACTAGTFTYMGQPFGYATAPVLTVTARSLGGGTTKNYTGAFFKLTNSSVNSRTYSINSGALDLTGVPAATSDPAILDLNNGVGSLTFSSGTGLAVTRTTPTAPFSAQISLSINVADTDGVTPATNPQPFSNIAFSSGNTMRYGRIAFRNAVGSELLNLPLPMHAEYFLDTTNGFVQNASDSCTTGVTLSFTNYGGNLNAGETCLIDNGSPGVSGLGCSTAGVVGQRFSMPPSSGDFIAILKAPGAGNNGTVTVTTTVPTWLQFDWNASIPGLENPSGIATFGIFQGETKRIFQIEK